MQIDIRIVNRVTELQNTVAEIFIVQGWPDQPAMVRRRIAQPRLLTCAAPGYWATRVTRTR